MGCRASGRWSDGQCRPLVLPAPLLRLPGFSAAESRLAQALITGVFSIVHQLLALNCIPPRQGAPPSPSQSVTLCILPHDWTL